jgi:hypothetical protein
MKLLDTLLLLGLAGWPGAVDAQLQLVPDRETPCVFAGQGREIAVVWRNAGNQRFEGEIRMALFQASSATAAPFGTIPWKNLEVLPGQTVMESAKLNFPAVNAATRFVIKWLAGADQVLGTSDVLVHPTNLLQELKSLVGDEPPGVLDPQNQLKPLLKAAAVDFSDLEDAGVEDYRGKLVIAGPFQSQTQIRNGLAAQLQAVAKKGAGVVWLLPAQQRQERPSGELRPSFYSVQENTNAVIVAQPDLVVNLTDNPSSQLNLICFCKLALHPRPPALPDLSSRP